MALSLTGALAVVLLLAPLAKMLAHGSTNYNEGWNAYHQQEAIQGKPLYGAPPGFVCTNYPPISFHLIGLASRVAGDVNQTGRWVSLLSLLLVAILCGSIVRLCTGSAPLAAYTALSVVIWLTVYLGNRIGMNDPQLLGTVFSLFGLYVYIRHPEKLGWLSISAAAFTISVFTKHNLLAFPAAVGLHLLLGGKWKRLAVWSGVVAGGSVLLVGLTRWVDGPYFVANILMPRTQTSWLENVTDYATLFQVPLAIALVWSLRHMGRSLTHIMALVVIVANVVAVAFAGGDGVDKNIFFDSLFSLAIVGAQFHVLDFDIPHGGLRGAVPHHPGQHQQGHAAAGHVGAEGVTETMRVRLGDAARRHHDDCMAGGESEGISTQGAFLAPCGGCTA